MQQVVGGEDPDRPGPLEHGEGLVERAAHGVVIGEEPRGFPGAQEKMRERLSAIVERAGLA